MLAPAIEPLTAIGVVGTYIGKVFTEVKGRARFYIEQETGVLATANAGHETKQDTKARLAPLNQTTNRQWFDRA
ncbi:Glycosyltransferase involved in cell wall bisynthesis (WcaA) [Fructobacillus fructosus]|uniref:Glycosyltransferase involved in cell wall bisynthesis (WcaA) n=1 Tax=Fructobacillus fructosus TaxID=1631 RepID=A0ABM9MYJ7_9LACO|nr:Glycosyltransferase involved in cell wall bisynthesis (WcaA) [Fructobacillus fructosus]